MHQLSPTRFLKTALLWLSCLITLTTYAAVPTPAPPDVAASGYLLVDFHSGKVLAEKGAGNRLEPASLTKIMTAYAVFRELKEGNINLEDSVLISEKAWRTPGSRMFIEVGKKVKVINLVKGMIIQSGNDACVALAEHIAGSEATFTELMNNIARELGMTDTHFTNSTGLPDDDHYTTPADIAKVAAATIRDFPEYYPWYSDKSFVFNDITQHNRNKLLWRDNSVDGIKTGHTEAAGYCLVASAQRESMRLISVVMGTKGEEARAQASQSLLNYGFRFYETHQLYTAGEVLNRARIWMGDKEKLPLGLSQDLNVTIPRHQYQNLDARMEIEPKIMAPVKQGEVLGHVSISLNGEPVTEAPLVALKSIADGNIWQLIKDSALLWLE
ncbi:MAG: D-alanyl-D-alanine carboxypeptidase family protein [Candidatus Thiodiazotropha endolucinida]|nr:D-alanyl-D-alanine carboxypeptidase [Candidatus Thiodiazotropha taylori]MCW4269466.1 D-alanyl-D-alanine carboxypeptidase [Candidatus Thiodiazotropha endolucinida]MCG7888813.1 D-alanyl-D-alanine carboxypeptidase [Candidatus Thiodiazotropha taylori]MCG7951113.1 D-alanyl-D-alanine carboxypeptidase [Candidatus Thiodiazotropha taylori]MCG8102834.1 D-alanyl-D-alanine carboxypeptidase [Candidatus Thiodiazotropha taylori]